MYFVVVRVERLNLGQVFVGQVVAGGVANLVAGVVPRGGFVVRREVVLVVVELADALVRRRFE